MGLLKTSLLSAVSVAIKVLTLLGINKVLAIYVGPSGYAALGQFQNAVQMITGFASSAINSGVTKYTAEYSNNEAKQYVLWRTAVTLAVIATLILMVAVTVLNEDLAIWLLKDAKYKNVFLWFAATLIFFTFNTLLLAILNGKGEVLRYAVANIAGSILALCFTSILAIEFGLYGALVAFVAYQSVSFFATLALCYKSTWFKARKLIGGIDKNIAQDLGKYAAMSLVSVACVPLSHIAVRNHLGENFGWVNAGYWEASWRLSAATLMLTTTILSAYFLPKLSALVDPEKIKVEINRGYTLLLPFSAGLGLIVYLMRDQVISLLFTSNFYAMRDLFAWQILGDILKTGSWIPAYLLISKAMFKTFMATEIIFSTSFYFFTIIFSKHWGFEGVAIAHAVNYLICWLVIAVIVHQRLRTLSPTPSQASQ